MTKFVESFGEHQGYLELRKICRQGSEFCKDICSIFSERAKVEQAYADGLSKLASKAQKTVKDTVGSLKSSWENIIQEMEAEAEVHRSLGSSLHEDVSKQTKSFQEGQTKTRKAVEAVVDKAYKNYSDRLSDAMKAKRSSHSKCKEGQALQEQLEEARQGRGKALSDKDITKLEARCRKSVESAAKSDKEYRDAYEKTERCRLEWGSALDRYCQTCESLEEERLRSVRETLLLYASVLAAVIPQMQQNYDSVKNEAWNVNALQDVQLVADIRGNGRGPADQILYDCYEGDLENSMNPGRRLECLEGKIQHLTNSLEREKKTRDGITTLLDAYSTTPGYTSDEGQDDVVTQLTHSNSVIDSFEASIWRLRWASAKCRSSAEPSHRLQSYVDSNRDKQGVMQSVLRLPLDQVSKVDSLPDATDNEFDDSPSVSPGLGQYRALYDYEAQREDELSISVGDIICVTSKLGGGWFEGEMNGNRGVFPESYVEEIN